MIEGRKEEEENKKCAYILYRRKKFKALASEEIT